MSKNERIIVIRNDDLYSCSFPIFNGLMFADNGSEDFVMEFFSALDEYAVMQYRKAAEHDFDTKQIIPYVVISDMSENKILSYARTTKGNEDRLHELRSIGFGGHMNELADVVDYGTMEEFEIALRQWTETFKLNIKKELEEEVLDKVEFTDDNLNLIGFINDESNDVGRVHLGVVFRYLIEDMQSVKIKEDKLSNYEWLSLENLKEVDLSVYENWSKLILDLLKNNQ